MIIGRFYFRLTTSGNLIGEFSNNLSLKNSTESADRIKGSATSFLGEYQSTWHEGGQSELLTLSIQTKPSAQNIFSLTWYDANGVNFWGEGFIVDRLLIGDYRDQSQIPIKDHAS